MALNFLEREISACNNYHCNQFIEFLFNLVASDILRKSVIGFSIFMNASAVDLLDDAFVYVYS